MYVCAYTDLALVKCIHSHFKDLVAIVNYVTFHFDTNGVKKNKNT